MTTVDPSPVRRTRRLVGAAVLVLLGGAVTSGATVVTAEAGLPAGVLTGVVAGPSAEAADCSRFRPADQVYFNDPRLDGDNDVQDVMECRIGQTPGGQTIRVATTNLDDPTLAQALIDADQRGVHVRVAVDRGRCDTGPANALRRQLGRTSGDRSKFRCVTKSGRTDSGVMHQKSLTITRTGGVSNVVLVGSANMTQEAYRDQWNDTFQYVRRPTIHRWYVTVFEQILADGATATPYREYTDGPARAQFLPTNSNTAAADPVLARIDGLDRGNLVRIAMYNWPRTDRGIWLRDAIIRQKRAGVRFRIAVGPAVNEGIVSELRGAGISVQKVYDDGCKAGHVEKTCNYTHTKFMTLRFTLGGRTEYRTWTGSDNFVDLLSAENIQRIGGRRIHDRYVAFFRRMVGAY
ncbi:hypothetical protein GCM10009737_02350 [Nocardioides lentus]|uniref:phospholipase D n=1 Tax=Nocardioides lentus TaxID=338077 RepID=A0ABP5A7E5_9ACTN